MDGERWLRLDSLFGRALGLEPAMRARFLAREAGDPELRREVEELLAACQVSEGFLERPILPRSVPRPAEAWRGRELGVWRVTEVLGRGGMGTVLAAERAAGDFRQHVAIKVLDRIASGEMEARFHLEREILARLEHPGIARLIDGGTTEEGLSYLVMERVSGLPIDRYCEREGLSVRQRLELFLEVCGAVQYAHRHLIVHRDLKPAHVLVTADGRPKLLDFGIAKLLAPSPGAAVDDITRHGFLALTPCFASPEQLYGESVGTASDVYALGVILYELLAARLPREVTSLRPEALAAAFAAEPPAPSHAAAEDPRARRHWRSLAADLDAVVLKALRPEPGSRYSSVEGLADDLRRVLAGRTVSARPWTPVYRLHKLWRRHRLALSFAVLLFLALAAFSAFSWFQAAELERQRNAARHGEASAQAVADFLADVLRDADPTRSGGRSVSVRDAVDQSVGRLPERLAGEREVHARLLHLVGSIYGGLGVADSARPLLEEALSRRRAELGPEHPMVAETLLELCRLETGNGTQAAAERRCRAALAILRGAAPEHPLADRVAEELARVLTRRWKLAEALAVQREAIRYREARLGSSAPETLLGKAKAARILGRLDRFAEARALAFELGGSTSSSPELLSKLGEVSWLVGEPGDAEALWRRGLAAVESEGGAHEPTALIFRNDIALALRDQGRLEDAASLLGESVAEAERVLGIDSYAAQVMRFNLAEVRLDQGLTDAAESLLERIEGALTHEELEPVLPELLAVRGAVRLRRGRAVEARDDFDQALGIWRRRLPEGHSLIAEARGRLGQSLVALGERAAGDAMLAESQEDLRRILGAGHPRARAAAERARMAGAGSLR